MPGRAYRRTMPRIPRRTLPDGVYHVTTRGVDGCSVFRDDADYRAFLTLLRDVATAQRWHVIAFSLMPNHVHLVLACTRQALSDGFRYLNGVHAQRFNRKYARTRPPLGRPLRQPRDRHRRLPHRRRRVRPRQRRPRRPRAQPRRLPLARRPRRRAQPGRTHVRRIHYLPHGCRRTGRPRRPRAQPQGHHRPPAAEPPDLHHRPVRVRASRAWPSTRSTPRASAATSSRSRPTRASSCR